MTASVLVLTRRNASWLHMEEILKRLGLSPVQVKEDLIHQLPPYLHPCLALLDMDHFPPGMYPSVSMMTEKDIPVILVNCAALPQAVEQIKNICDPVVECDSQITTEIIQKAIQAIRTKRS